MIRICNRCGESKRYIDYYFCSGKPRSECKTCTIRRNIIYQRQVKAWKSRYETDEARKIYMRAYYHKNKQKFAKYREDFRLRYPDYYKDYFRKRKEKNTGEV